MKQQMPSVPSVFSFHKGRKKNCFKKPLKFRGLETEGSRLRFSGPSCYLHGCFLVRTHQNHACGYTLDGLFFIL